ncbi:MAG TPA: signal peptidase I [Gemmataceae bacterium]|nr:signal peptidase I [Gemmataceae bacterium]
MCDEPLVAHTKGTIRNPDRFLCNKAKVPMRWDVIAFRFPKNPTVSYIKRLVGMPGETISIKEGAVWVNGERLTPPARLGPVTYRSLGEINENEVPPPDVVLGPDQFFVLGDNTNASADSRDWGPVPRDHVVGVVDVIYWPPGRWRLNP